MSKYYDVVIVGAGPAGLFAAYEIVSKSSNRIKIAIVDKGARAIHRRCPMMDLTKKARVLECINCRPCHVMHGIGGAGALSSGIINLRPDVGGDLDKLLGSWEEAYELIKYIDSIFIHFGAPNNLYKIDEDKASELERLAAKAGAKFIPTPQRHIGSENTPQVIERLTEYLEKNSVSIYTYTEATNIARENNKFYKIITSRGEIYGEYLVLAPGRSGSSWLAEVSKRIGVETVPGPLDIGVRIEVPAYVTEPITRIVRDPKIIMYTKAYDDMVRTFCTNPNGFVVEEKYDDGTVGVNGESYTSIRSKNTNLALLATIRLTDPLEDTIAYGKHISMLTTKLGGGKPIIQRLGDLRAGRRSTWYRIDRSTVEPTLKAVTPGDISMAYPYRVVANIIEALERLDTIMPGIASHQTLLYAPEIKFYSVKVVVNKDLETTQEKIFVAGDGAGLSRGINVAAATGVLAARGIMKRLGIDFDRDITS
ncbi:MAG: NAD(P)/FAD-dependent oxidoreductase [Sulfolobales archaeon]